MAQGPVTKRRRISPRIISDYVTGTSNGEGGAAEAAEVDDFVKRAAHWSLEQDYEQRPRKKRKDAKETTRLPIKTAEGKLRPSLLKDVPDLSEGSASETSDDDEGEPEVVQQEAEDVPELPLTRQILEAKEELARIAGLINEDPEENAGSFRALSQFGASNNVTIKKLALAAQCAVYKDVIPGYRIRPLSDEHSQVKVSKEVRRQRNYEQALVGGYQTYLQELARLAKLRRASKSEEEKSLASVAISCACALLLAVPHFNFREVLLQIVVDTLSFAIMDADFLKCVDTLQNLFKADEDGKPSRDAVALIAKLIKARSYHVHESVLNTFLHLRLLSEFSSKGSHDKVDDANGQNNVHPKKSKKKEFRTKKQRKLHKERKAVEKEMREADATVSYEERDQMQAETLKLVFVTYFRILKAHPPGLMGAVLEGLAKFAHLINQDFFGDLLEVLKDLIGRRRLGASESNEEDKEENDDDDDDDDDDADKQPNHSVVRENLLCALTAFSLLQGQDIRSAARTLNLDLRFFITHIYNMLYSICLDPNIEQRPKSLHLPDALSTSPTKTHNNNTINIQTTTVLLLRCLSAILLPPTHSSSSAIPPIRLAAFTKQLLTTTLHLPEKSCLATLALTSRLTSPPHRHRHHKSLGALWRTDESRADGVFHPLAPDPDAANPFASTVWEGELLRRHFSPVVRRALEAVEGNVKVA